jgi:hypothetical protein
MRRQGKAYSSVISVLVVLCALGFLLVPEPASSHNPITTTVLFNREIATLFNRKCAQCHAQGELAMPLQTYEESRPWAVAIKEEVLARRMPPWPADPSVGRYSNNIGLTTRELDFLISWVDGGAPEGDGQPPERVDHSGHWMLGTPDRLVTATRGATIQPGARPAVTRLVVETGLTQATWVKAIDYKPGDARVTRAAFITVDGTGEYVGAWTPWAPTSELPEGAGVRLPARARLAIDVLYQGADEAVTDTPRIGLYLARTPTHALGTTTLTAAQAQFTAPADMQAVALRVDMGSGARSMEVRAMRPDGAIEPLLLVRDYRQEWQTPFVFATPRPLPRGTVVQAMAHFDASARDRQFTVTLASLTARAPLPRATTPSR